MRRNRLRRAAGAAALVLLGLGLPGALMFRWGARSLQAERRLLEAQATRRADALADALAEESARLTEDARKPLLLLSAFPLGEDPVERTRRLWAASGEGDVYAVDAERRPLCPPVPPPDDPLPQAEPSFGALEPEFRHWERREFVPEERAAALKGFEGLLTKNPPPELAVRLLTILGAERAKDGDGARAAEAYEMLRARYGDRTDAGGWPVDLLARLRLAELASASSPARGAALRRELREALAFGRWPISDALRAEVARELASASDPSPAERARWRAVEDWARRGRFFWKTVWPSVAGELAGKDARAGVVFQTPEHAVAVAAAPDGGWYVSSRPLRGWESRWETLFADFSSRHGATARWARAGESGPRVRTVPALRPERRVAVDVPPPAAEWAALRRRAWVFGGLLAASFGVLGVGLFVTVLALRRRAEAGAMKADFIANVSHELRTPLASIAYIAERLAAGRVRSPAEVEELHGMLREETGRLTELVDGVLDFSRSLAGKAALRVSTEDLGALARESLRRFEGKARARGFTMTLEDPGAPRPASVDPRAVVQAVMNLLDNAVKYSGASRRVRVSVPARPGFVGIAVHDEGVGLDASERARIFDKFYRVERPLARSSEGGVGLGLAFVHNIMDVHGGTVDVDSDPGRGSTFTLWFPSSGALNGS